MEIKKLILQKYNEIVSYLHCYFKGCFFTYSIIMVVLFLYDCFSQTKELTGVSAFEPALLYPIPIILLLTILSSFFIKSKNNEELLLAGNDLIYKGKYSIQKFNIDKIKEINASITISSPSRCQPAYKITTKLTIFLKDNKTVELEKMVQQLFLFKNYNFIFELIDFLRGKVPFTFQISDGYIASKLEIEKYISEAKRHTLKEKILASFKLSVKEIIILLFCLIILVIFAACG